VNIGLVAALVLLIVAGAGLLAGPASQLVATHAQQLEQVRQRFDAWSREQAGFRRIDEAERSAQKQRWHDLLQRLEPIADDPALVASVARRLSAPSVSRFEVARRGPAVVLDEGGEPDTSKLRLAAPFDTSHIEVDEIPLRVSFRASYRDALSLIEGLESHRLPARIEGLEIKRDAPGVWLRLDLTWYGRSELRDEAAAQQESS